MSYKYTTGSVRRGDIYFEDDTQGEQTYIDFGYDTITLRPSGSAILFAEDDAVGIGTTNPQTTLHVKGDPGQFRVEDTTVDYAYTIDCDGDGIRTHFGDMTGGGDEDSFMSFGAYSGINRLDTAARDFHIYGTTTTTGFYFDESAGKFGIGTDAPDYTLDVAGNIGVDGYIYHNGDGNTLINFADDKIVLKAGGKAMITMEEKASSPHEVTINDGSNNIDFVVKGNGSNAGNPGMKFDASNNRLGINGVGSPSYELDVAGDIGLNEYIYHKGDDDTLIRFQDDDITIKAGNINFINFASGSQTKLTINDSRDDLDFIVRSPNENLAVYLNADNEVFHINHGESNFKTKIHSLHGEAMTVNDDGTIFNEDGAAGNDFRVESDTNTHMLFVDAGSNEVGIGTSSPGSSFQAGGSVGFNVSSFGSDSNIDETHYTCVGNCGGGGGDGNVTLTLPAATDAMAGRVYVFKRADTGTSAPGGSTLLVARNGAYIDGDTDNLQLGNGDCYTIQCVGQSLGWIVLGSYVPI